MSNEMGATHGLVRRGVSRGPLPGAVLLAGLLSGCGSAEADTTSVTVTEGLEMHSVTVECIDGVAQADEVVVPTDHTMIQTVIHEGDRLTFSHAWVDRNDEGEWVVEIDSQCYGGPAVSVRWLE